MPENGMIYIKISYIHEDRQEVIYSDYSSIKILT